MTLATIGAALLTPAAAEAATYRWKVDADGDWTNSANWEAGPGGGNAFGYPNGVGDVAEFTGTYTDDRRITVPDGVTITVGEIVIQTDHVIRIVGGTGNSAKLALANGSAATLLRMTSPGGNTFFAIEVPIELQSGLAIDISNEDFAVLHGITEAGGSHAVTKRGVGSVTFQRLNSYTGTTTIEEGEIVLDADVGPSVPGDLVIGTGAASDAPRARVVLSGGAEVGQITDTGRVWVRADGLFHDTHGQALVPNPPHAAGGPEERIGDLIVDDGVVFLFEDSQSAPTLVMRSLTMTGGRLEAGNGRQFVVDGPVTATSSPKGPAIIRSETVDGTGSLDLLDAVHTFTIGDGPAAVDLEIALTVTGTAGAGLVKQGPGTLRFAGPAPEIPSVTVTRGDVVLGNGSGIPVTWTVPRLIMDGGTIALTDRSLLRLAEVTATSRPAQTPMIHGDGFVVIDAAGLSLTIGDGPQPIDLRIDARISAGSSAAGVLKRGAGAVQFAGTNTYATETTVQQGVLCVTGTQPSSPIVVSGGTLCGTGAVGAVSAAAGTIAPGLSPGRLAAHSVDLTPGATYAVELNGTTAGAGFDQLAVGGTVNLGGAGLALTVAEGLVPPLDASFTILDNDGTDPIAGTFAGLAEGHTITAGRHQFTISYRGGDGNDVVLTHTTPLTYFLAEGATGAFFDDDVLIANPNEVAAPVTLTFLQEGGATVVEKRMLAPQSRMTVHVDAIAGLEATSASVQVTSDDRVPLVVERSMFWDASYYGGHTANAVAQPEKRWIFAEGFQGFFDTYILIGNTNSDATTATLTFLREQEAPVVKTIAIEPFARKTVHAGEFPEILDRAFGVVVEATLPVIAERAMYFASQPDRIWAGGHVNTGVAAPSTSWFHAEGATGGFFSTFILLSNPQDRAAHVELRFLLDTGEVVTRTKTIEARQRLTINPADEGDARLENAAVSTVVQSDVPIVSERSMYWPGEALPFGEGHNSSGVVATATRWGLAEGRIGGPRQFDTFILLANPSSSAAEVTIAYLRESDAPIVKTYTVPATSRFNVDVKSVPELQDASFGARIEVTNGVPIAVERSLYWNAGGVLWAGGTNALATPLP